MTMTRRALTFGLLLLLMTGACGRVGSEELLSPVTESPLGRVYVSTSLTERGKPHPLSVIAQVRIAFEQDGHITADGGCNTLTGTAKLLDGVLAVTDLATTDMGCNTGRRDQGDWLAAFLRSTPRWHLAGEQLDLISGDTVLSLAEEPAAVTSELRGRRWVVDTLVTGEVAASAPRAANAFLEFRTDGTITGSTGCNTFNGAVSVSPPGGSASDGSITFGELVATRRSCTGDARILQAAILAVLQGTVQYAINANYLSLTAASTDGLQLKAH